MNAISKTELIEQTLKTLCKKSNICLDLGYQSEIIKEYFGNYNLSDSLVIQDYVNICKRIGAPSANGAVILVPFERNGYKSFTALKMPCSNISDNLMYEYAVGVKFINNFVKIFPCFAETYGLYKIGEETNYLKIIENASKNKSFRIDSYNFNKKNISWITACTNPKMFCLLIQYFENFRSIEMDYEDYFSTIGINIMTILYQYYFVFDRLRGTFTHYDFHYGNAGYYEPFTNGYIMMHYHHPDNTVTSFPTQYISKMIDYGRSHFSNTIKIMNNIKSNAYCVPNDGEEYGFSIIKGMPNEKPTDRFSSFYWINPLYSNCSHDLRCLDLIFYRLKKLFYFADEIIYENKYGTPELRSNVNIAGKKIITNVTNAELYLREFITSNIDKIQEQIVNKNLELCGELHVYSDGRPYEWILK
jgi:hypothetical protein